METLKGLGSVNLIVSYSHHNADSVATIKDHLQRLGHNVVAHYLVIAIAQRLVASGELVRRHSVKRASLPDPHTHGGRRPHACVAIGIGL